MKRIVVAPAGGGSEAQSQAIAALLWFGVLLCVVLLGVAAALRARRRFRAGGFALDDLCRRHARGIPTTDEYAAIKTRMVRAGGADGPPATRGGKGKVLQGRRKK